MVYEINPHITGDSISSPTYTLNNQGFAVVIEPLQYPQCFEAIASASPADISCIHQLPSESFIQASSLWSAASSTAF